MLGKRLRYGDTIGIVAPAGIESAEKIKNGIEKLKSLGFKIKEGKSIYKKWGYFAGDDFERSSDIMEMFIDKTVDMILCVRGGYGAMRLLPYLDFNIIRRNPKIFIGYSDITVLLNSIYKNTKLITFHGPMLNSDLDNECTLSSLIGTLMNGNNNYVINNPSNMPIISNCRSTVKGKIVGGNLSLICSTLGTKYEVDTDNNILFMEEVGEVPYRIDRMFTQLILSKKLRGCVGIILGQFTECDNYEEGFSLSDVIKDRLLGLNKPMLMNFASGHDNPKLTLPIGAEAVLNCKSKCIEIIERVVK